MNRYRVKPGQRLHLRDEEAEGQEDYKNEKKSEARSQRLNQELELFQERLYAEGTRSVLVVLQGMDTSGKDGTIRHVFSGVNPQGCEVTSFKVPTPLEKSHDFLWRVHKACPSCGSIGIFNRSHYEDVLVPRVHGSITDKQAERRFKQIRDFESMLSENGTRVVKFFLHISKEEQKNRLLERMDNKDKHWKFSEDDLKERKYWKSYRIAYEEAISATSTKESPWYIVPADHKWYRNLVVAEGLLEVLKDMDPQPPKVQGYDWKKIRRSL